MGFCKAGYTSTIDIKSTQNDKVSKNRLRVEIDKNTEITERFLRSDFESSRCDLTFSSSS